MNSAKKTIYVNIANPGFFSHLVYSILHNQADIYDNKRFFGTFCL